mmetsp:Transcript_52457/g.94244  ORF Transcript_52457/g.94244 Transcript_52457/m.94244 type:complete len:322 (-) Transcript_52457:375-1340(-)
MVTVIADEQAFRREVAAASEKKAIACVLFHAEWAGAGKFGKEDLERLSSETDKIHCLAVDAGSEAGEELAFTLGVSAQPPVIRLYHSTSKEALAEYVGAACKSAGLAAKAIEMQAQLQAKADAEAAKMDVEGQGIRDTVRTAYAATAVGGKHVLPGEAGDVKKRRELLGYSEQDVTGSADLGLGCGNPLGTAKLQPGEIVLDLGSGAGMDVFIAAREVGEKGHVVGVDMTPEMVQKARANARKDKVTNVSFRLGEIEHLPCGDSVIDCLISNCVINLSPDKPQVYREMTRVLKPGGRISISDVLRTSDIPQELQTAQSYNC